MVLIGVCGNAKLHFFFEAIKGLSMLLQTPQLSAGLLQSNQLSRIAMQSVCAKNSGLICISGNVHIQSNL